jgi:putative flippase GtrA
MPQFIVFAVVGAVATVTQYATLIVLVELIGINTTLASTVGLVIGVLTNYVLSYNVTFKSKLAHLYALPRFLTISGIGLLVNWVILETGSAAGIHYLALQVLSTVTLLALNYIASRFWVFRKRAERCGEPEQALNDPS